MNVRLVASRASVVVVVAVAVFSKHAWSEHGVTDAALAAVVENYAPERIDPVDRAILRLATHELLHTDTPAKVAINEAVELAKRFGTSDSARFVNGVLDCIARRGTATATHSGL